MKALLLVPVLALGVPAEGWAQTRQPGTGYSQGEVYQVTWYMMPEHPVTTSHVLERVRRVLPAVGPGHGYFRATIKPGKRLHQVEKALLYLKPAVPAKVGDVRVVALFYARDHTDTLSIDNWEVVRFQGHPFKLTKRLAKLLGAEQESLVVGERRQLEIIDARRKRGS